MANLKPVVPEFYDKEKKDLNNQNPIVQWNGNLNVFCTVDIGKGLDFTPT